MNNACILLLATMLLVSCQDSTDKKALFKRTLFKLSDYYPIANGNEWRYTAPENWPDGDYISKIVADTQGFANLLVERANLSDSLQPNVRPIPSGTAWRHYDATKAAKLLIHNEKGLYYIGEAFSGGKSFVLFDRPILWFPAEFEMAYNLMEERGFTQFHQDGRRTRGLFRILQMLPKVETVEVPAGKFADCLRMEFETYWNFGNGSDAKSINIYHHAKGVGVVKAAARFVVLQDGKELVNRLVEPDLKTFSLF